MEDVRRSRVFDCWLLERRNQNKIDRRRSKVRANWQGHGCRKSYVFLVGIVGLVALTKNHTSISVVSAQITVLACCRLADMHVHSA